MADSGDLKRKYSDKEEVCKDFLRGRCSYGVSCRYAHPADGSEGTEAYGMGGGKRRKLVFCQDFQSEAGCAWPVCRFIHATAEEEEEYLSNGNITEKLAYAILVAGQGDKKDIGGREVCMDFLMGRCSREAGACKHLHVDPEKVMTAAARDRDLVGDKRICLDFLRGVCDRPSCKYSHDPSAGKSVDPFNPPADYLKRNQANRRTMGRGGPRGGRVQPYDTPGMMPMGYGRGGPVGPGYVGGGAMGPGPGGQQTFFLQQTVSRLKVQVATLMEEKEELMEHNTRLQAKVQRLVHQLAADEYPAGGIGAGNGMSASASLYNPAGMGYMKFDTDY